MEERKIIRKSIGNNKEGDRIMDNEYLNIKEVAEKLGIKAVTVYKYIREGKFKGVYFKLGGIYRFSRQPLEKYLEDMIEGR